MKRLSREKLRDVNQIILYYHFRMEKGAVGPSSTVRCSLPCSRTSCPSPSSSPPRTKVPVPCSAYLTIIVTDDTEGRRCIDRRLLLPLLYPYHTWNSWKAVPWAEYRNLSN